MEEQHPRQPEGEDAFRRYSLRTLLVGITIVACAITILLQKSHITGLERSLARYDPSATSTSLANDEYRVVVRTVLDHAETKIVEFRVETTTEHFAQLAGKVDGVGATTSVLEPETGLYVTTATVLVDHVRPDRVKMFPKFGGAQGYSVLSVPEDFAIGESFEFFECEGVYDKSTRLGVFRWQGETYTLSVK